MSSAFISEYLHVCFVWKMREQMRDVYSNKHEVCSRKLFTYWKNRKKPINFSFGFIFVFVVFSFFMCRRTYMISEEIWPLKTSFQPWLMTQRDSFALWKVFKLYNRGIFMEWMIPVKTHCCGLNCVSSKYMARLYPLAPVTVALFGEMFLKK